MKISKKRQAELFALAEDSFQEMCHFDYHNFDGLIECEEMMTDDELDWLRENAEVYIEVF